MEGACLPRRDVSWRRQVLVSRKDGIGNMVGPLSDVRKVSILVCDRY
jgi:hypothetical protein